MPNHTFMSIVGIDEAGRGPVIGPMVMAGVRISDEKQILNLGLKDSKLLSRKQREALYKVVQNSVDAYSIHILSPSEIDASLLSDTSNLNWLEADCSVKILGELRPKVAIIDSPSINVEKYSRYIQEALAFDISLIVEHKADFNYPVVSAASILAKVTRDWKIDAIKKEIGIDFGSGYPSDPLTKRFVQEHYKDFPDIFRRTWSPYRMVLEGSQRKIDDFE